MQIVESTSDGGLKIALTEQERSMPYLDAIAAMESFLVKQLGPVKAAEYEHWNVSDPGFAHFRLIGQSS